MQHLCGFHFLAVEHGTSMNTEAQLSQQCEGLFGLMLISYNACAHISINGVQTLRLLLHVQTPKGTLVAAAIYSRTLLY